MAMAKKKVVRKVKRIVTCCPHRSLPKGMTWVEAKKKGWLRGWDMKGTCYYCPKTRDTLP
jgi:hypothetical protein